MSFWDKNLKRGKKKGENIKRNEEIGKIKGKLRLKGF
jgi:hypothetical protein